MVVCVCARAHNFFFLARGCFSVVFGKLDGLPKDL